MWRCKKCGGKIIMDIRIESEISVEIGKNRQPIRLAKKEKARSIMDLIKTDWGEFPSFYVCEKCKNSKQVEYIEEYIEELDKMAYWDKN